jgi:hypothetical protein
VTAIIPAVVARLIALVGGKKKQPSIAAAAPKTAADKTAGNASPESAAVPLAIDIGWTMAVIYGQARPASANDQPAVNDRLPTEHELAPAARINLEVVRVNALLARLDALLPPSPDPKRKRPAVQLTSDSAGETLSDANLAILEWLACAGREYSVAYQLGRALRDTAAPPVRTGDAQKALMDQLSRGRVSRLQEWLATLESYLPASTAAIVSASIGRWSDLITTIFLPSTPGKLRKARGQGAFRQARPSAADVVSELTKSLLPQGDAWINLLVGAESADVLLTPEGLVAAGEAALGRTARMVKRIAVHYWFVLLVLAIAVAAAVYFANRDIHGAGKIWTQIAAVASGLGITAKGAGNTLTRLSEDAEKPIFGAARIDAMAWAITAIPADLKLNRPGVKALRQAGIPPSGPMGR